MKEDIVDLHDWKGKLDLLNIVMIGLAKELAGYDKKYELRRLLGELLSKELVLDGNETSLETNMIFLLRRI